MIIEYQRKRTVKWRRLVAVTGLFAGAACSAGAPEGAERPEKTLLAVTTSGRVAPPITGGAGPLAISLATYGGGQIVSPEIVSLYWGTFPVGRQATMQSYITNLAMHISGSTTPPTFEPVVAQYGVHGAVVGATYADTTLPSHNGVAGHATRDDLAGKIAQLQAAGHLPAYGPERVFMVFTDGITFDDAYGSQWCGEHFAAGAGQYYAVVPFPSASGCGSGGFGGFDATGVWQSITSHEVFEAATDPAAFAQGVGAPGWTPEIADDCAWGNNLIDMGWGVVQQIADRQTASCAVWAKEQLSTISAVSEGTSSLDLLGLGSLTGHGLVHQSYRPATGWSASWEDLGGTFTSPPVAVAGAFGAGTLDVFAQGTDNGFYHKQWNGSAWVPAGTTTWDPVGGTYMGQPAVVSTAPGRIDLFGQGIDGAYYHRTLTSSGWSALELVGGTFNGPPTVVAHGSLTIDLLGRGINGSYYYKRWSNGNFTPAGPTNWELASGGTYVSEPAAVVTADGLHVYGQGTDYAYYHFAKTASGWSGLDQIAGTFIGAPVVASQDTSTIDLIGQGTDGGYYHTQRSGSVQSALEAVQGQGYGAAALVRPSLGTLNLFIEGTDRGAYYKAISGTTWTPAAPSWFALQGTLH